jgi:hypothetical protein
LAALRIATGLLLFFDVMLTYYPFRHDYFGPGSLSEPSVFVETLSQPNWGWSLIHWFPQLFTPDVICWVWAGAAVAMTLGLYPRIAALIGWAMAISVWRTNPYLHNSGDVIRQNLLMFLMLTPCGAAWSIIRPRKLARSDKAAIYPWALRLLFLQLVAIYFLNGVYKVVDSQHWRDGTVMHNVLHTPGWSRWSPPIDLPLWLTAGLTYFVLAWELLFPLLVLIRATRTWALLTGVFFHLATFFNLEIATFGLYALVCYIPLLPWECRWTQLEINKIASVNSEKLECAPA